MRSLHTLAATILLGCSGSTVLPGSLPGEFELGVGDRAIFRGYGVEVRFEGITADSRCPVDVTCVWEGDAAAVVLLSAPGEAADTTTLHTALDGASTDAGSLTLTLVGVAPLPHEGTAIDPATYRIRLRAEEH